MRMRVLAFLLVFAGWWGSAAAENGAAVTAIVSSVPALPVTTVGQSVIVHGSGFQQGAVAVSLRKGDEQTGDKGRLLDCTVSPDGTTVSFRLTNDVADGIYLVFLEIGHEELPVPGDLRITRDPSARVVLDSVWPETVYPNGRGTGSDFALVGHNLGTLAYDNVVVKDKYGELPLAPASDCVSRAAAIRSGKFCLVYDDGMARRKLNVLNCPRNICSESTKFAIRIADAQSEFQTITFSRIGEFRLRCTAVLVFLALVAVVLGLVWKGIENNKLAGHKTGVVSAFFLDRQTNSFSLSKLQVILWTTVCVYSYVYLYLCRIFIQGSSDFPQIPDNWPTLLGVSAGTTVLAAGITRFHGSKGSGPIHPSLADFVCSGGLVVGERFQFFIWTLMGSLGYFVIVVLADPISLSSLPDVKGPFLTLMGVSSAGYLAGKYARMPGPIIDLLTILTIGLDAKDPTRIAMILQIKGQNLSEGAVIKIDDATLRTNEFDIDGATAQDQPSGSNLFSLLNVTIRDADRFRKDKHALFLINEDGQSACISFPMNPLTLNSPGAIEEGDQPLTVNISGCNITGNFTGVWVNPKQPAAHRPPVAVVNKGNNTIDVTLTPGPAGSGTLTITSDAQLQTSIDMVVNPKRIINPGAAAVP